MLLRRTAPAVVFNVVAVAAVLLSVLHSVSGYSAGAPDSQCDSMSPNHDGAPQSIASPYTVTPSAAAYVAGGPPIIVTLSGSPQFKGFLLEARRSLDDTLVGTFQNFPLNTKSVCSGKGVTQSKDQGWTDLALSWQPPSTFGSGNVYFVATFVQSRLTFWVKVTSTGVLTEEAFTGTAISMTTPPDPTTTIKASTTPAPLFDYVDTDECGLSLACFRKPSGCSAASCDYVLSWADAGSAVSFQMYASVADNNYWVGFGMSLDSKMGDDSVVSCFDKDGVVTVESSWNKGRDNELSFPDPQYGLVAGTLSGTVSNGGIVCRFHRLKTPPPASTGARRASRATGGELYALDSSEYYILVAKGPTSNGKKRQHSDVAVSQNPVNFTAFAGAEVNESKLKKNLIKAHGILMMFGWMVFASFGMLLPRYFKPAWPDKTWFGKKIWFQLHQPVMIIALLLTVAGFVIVFAAVKDYSDLPSPTVAHPPLGIVVMALVIINPVMALFRPDPNTKFRPLFNVLHFLVGLLAHLAAVVTLFLGMYMTTLNLPLWCKGVMAAFICFHALIEVILAIHMHSAKCCRSSNIGRKNNYELNTNDRQQQTQVVEKQPSGSVFKTIMLSIHFVGVLGLCIAISVQVGIS